MGNITSQTGCGLIHKTTFIFVILKTIFEKHPNSKLRYVTVLIVFPCLISFHTFFFQLFEDNCREKIFNFDRGAPDNFSNNFPKSPRSFFNWWTKSYFTIWNYLKFAGFLSEFLRTYSMCFFHLRNENCHLGNYGQ